MGNNSQSAERMKILDMVESGKITVDEAMRLFEVLGETVKRNEPSDFNAKMSEFTKHVENFAHEAADKMSGAYKHVEPTLKQATRVVVEKTTKAVDELAKFLNENLKNMKRDNDCCCQEEKCDCTNEPLDETFCCPESGDKMTECCECDDKPIEN